MNTKATNLGELVDKHGDKESMWVRRHDSLPEDFQTKAKAIWECFGGMTGITLEKWLDGFCYDAHPVRELECWATYAALFKKHTEGKPAYYRPIVWRAIQEHLRQTPLVHHAGAKKLAAYLATPDVPLSNVDAALSPVPPCPFTDFGYGKSSSAALWKKIWTDLQSGARN